VHWFLNGKEDTRSSYYLEDAATEFQVQGLELNWACVSWDGDLRFTGSGWSFHDFRGDRWCNIANGDNRRYLRNTYRVLLTRARQGMVIFVPPGDPSFTTQLSTIFSSLAFRNCRDCSSIAESKPFRTIFLTKHYRNRQRIAQHERAVFVRKLQKLTCSRCAPICHNGELFEYS
jgi:hypothetical protein